MWKYFSWQYCSRWKKEEYWKTFVNSSTSVREACYEIYNELSSARLTKLHECVILFTKIFHSAVSFTWGFELNKRERIDTKKKKSGYLHFSVKLNRSDLEIFINKEVMSHNLIWESWFFKAFLKLRGDPQGDLWTLSTLNHTKQQDSDSCGVYCLMVSMQSQDFKWKVFMILD